MPQGEHATGGGSPESRNVVLPALHEFNRVESPTQTSADAVRQQNSMEIWGLPAQGSIFPCVQAWREAKRPLSRFGPRGIMFDTSVAPTRGTGTPFEARWYDGTPGVIRKHGSFVAIAITTFLNLQP
jgi:hypothetical protein